MKSLLFVLSFLFVVPVMAQDYGNEWIDYSQKYYKFKIHQTGVYKITYSDIIGASINLNSINSDQIQIFGREQEIPLLISDGGDNSLDSGDYILFYGEKNDGWLDSTLYDIPEELGNPAYSLYNDTINYFFTWNNTGTGLRYQLENDLDFSSYTPAEYILWKEHLELHNLYYEGENLADLSSSFFINGEGFGSSHYNGPYTYTYNAPTANRFVGPSAPLVEFEGKSFSSNDAQTSSPDPNNHHLRWKMGSSDSLLLDTLFSGVKSIRFQTSFPSGSLINGITPVKWNNVGDLAVNSDKQGFSYISLKFPKQPILTGLTQGKFEVVNSTNQNKIRLDLQSWTGSNSYLFIHGDSPKYVLPTVNGTVKQALISNSTNGQNQSVYFVNENLFKSIGSIVPVNGNGTFTDYSTMIEDSSLIMVYNKKLEAGKNDYQVYRESPAGGSYHVISSEISELYDQFGGGIPKHINSIRRFTKFIYDNSVQKPAGLLLLGKAIREASVYSFPFASEGARTNVNHYANSLVPSFGQPSSDIAITASWEVGNWNPMIPTGRISVNSNVQLNDYLEKVIAFDIQQDQNSVYDSPLKDWQKHVMHLGGGTTIQEQTAFRSFLESMEYKIERESFGGEVMRVYKSNSDPLDPTKFAEIAERLAKGVSLMNFFGHANSQSSGFEINLDDPQNWNNKGKYPIVIANSCYNGNIFYHEDLGVSTSERFVRAVDAGAVAFVSSVSLGFSNTLYLFSDGLYKEFSQSYGQTLGEQIKRNIEFLEANSSNPLMEATVLQMALNGDPLLKLNWHEKPEIELLEEYVEFGPENIDLTTDSIELTIDLKNLGRSIIDTFSLEIIRDFPQSNIDSVYTFEINGLHYQNEIKIKFPLQPGIGIGLNNFTISADIPSFIDENYDEFNNNQIKRTLFIDIDDIIPVYPQPFAVVPKDTISLIGSTVNPIGDINTYLFEIDTTDSFDSPFLRNQNVSSKGGVIKAEPSLWTLASNNQSAPLTLEDSIVYFWRVALSDTALIWKENSFQYIVGKEGWGQDHFYQFKDNHYNNISYNKPDRKKRFTVADTTWLDCYANGDNVSISSNQWLINNQQQDYAMCQFIPQIQVGVVDPVTMTSWGTHYGTQNPDHIFGNYNENGACRGRVEKYFLFRQDNAAQLAAFQNMVLNEVPDGHYIVIYCPYFGARYDLWNSLDSAGMYSTFEALGSDSINSTRTNAPLAFFVRKGSPSTMVEALGVNAQDGVHVKGAMIGLDFLGQESAPLVGPAKEWKSFHWKLTPEEAANNDTTHLQIDAYNNNKQYQYTIDLNLNKEDSITNLETVLNAVNSPYLSLRSIYTDSVTFTPAQLDRWHVLFEGYPEAAIDGSENFYWSAENIDTLEEGVDVQFAIDVSNILDKNMDSLLVHYFVEDADHKRNYLAVPRRDSLRVNQTQLDTVTFSTVGFPGLNSFWMEVNPLDSSGAEYDQPELYHFNNILQIPFRVRMDDINPILDVTFDGRHILNGDIVNPKSEIYISLKDENPFLLMDEISDTSLFGVYLTYPNGDQHRVNFENTIGETVMQWIPADATNKRFKIIYPADFKEDGIYTLLVQGSDKSGNLSGDFEYRVSFEVINESTITHMINYPNPFSTSTRFVFTLTGSEIPDDLIIQIMTINGRVVKEITEQEFGPMRIGNNISEYAWDGTDEFGDRLANGVYLYQVKMRMKGERIEHRESGADAHFKNNFGKMYILR